MKPAEFQFRLQSAGAGPHRLMPPLSRKDLGLWQANHPDVSLPDEQIDFYRISNGARFWVDTDPSGYLSLSPLEDLMTARQRIWLGDGGLRPDDVPLPHWLAISDHVDGADFIVLDTDASVYYQMDSCGADLSCPIGPSFEDVLDHVWNNWVLR